MKQIREWISIHTVKTPKLIVLLGIMVANLLFISAAALVVMWLAPPSLEPNDFWSCVFYALTMFLSGYMETAVDDIGQAGAFFVMFCVFTVIIGMIVFTGAVIGYMTEFISSFVENADSSSRKLHVSHHTVVLNWNNRAPEIINELLCKNTKEKVVILVDNDRDAVLSDINERLSDSIEDGNEAVREAAAQMSFFKRRSYIRKNSIKNKLIIIVREGESWSAKQLNDVSIKQAKSVIILCDGLSGAFDGSGSLARAEKVEALTIKTLLQVAQLSTEEDSADNQKIVVEVEDDRTLSLVNTIIAHKTLRGDDSIVPVAVNHILGQIFSQISIMPELNVVYSALFSNRGAAFYSRPVAELPPSEDEFICAYLDNHLRSIPLTIMQESGGKLHFYYMSDSERDLNGHDTVPTNPDFRVSINPDYEIADRYVLILGHNSRNSSIMEGFVTFNNEWKKKDGSETLEVIVIDDETYLAKQDNYKQYPCVKRVVAADVFEKELICGVIDEFIGAHYGDGCILILSDDAVCDEELDADALTYLIMVQDILDRRLANDPGFDPDSIDMVVEILNPKNYDVVSNYSTKNIVISNRYLSKIIAQIGEKEAMFDLYYDILTYDEPEQMGKQSPDLTVGEGSDAEAAASKELYIKKVSEFFNEIPGPCTAADLIRAVYHSSPDDNKSVVLGYFRSDGEMILFEGDQSAIHLVLTGDDKLINFSNH